MNIKLYNAAITQLRGEALESLALLELLLTDPTVVPDHSSLVAEITKHSKQLAAYEGAMITLQQYFAPPASAPQPQTPPSPEPVVMPGKGITAEELLKRSPTLRKATGRKRKKALPKEEANE